MNKDTVQQTINIRAERQLDKDFAELRKSVNEFFSSATPVESHGQFFQQYVDDAGTVRKVVVSYASDLMRRFYDSVKPRLLDQYIDSETRAFFSKVESLSKQVEELNEYRGEQ